VVSSLGLVTTAGRFDPFMPQIFEVCPLYYIIIQTPEQLKEIKHSPTNKKEACIGYLMGLLYYNPDSRAIKRNQTLSY
jgi:hypothetical protein